MNHGWIYTDVASRSDSGRTVVDFYSTRYTHSDRATWAARCAAGEIELNGRTASADVLLQRGDRLAWHRPPWEEPPVPTDYQIVFEDSDIVVVDKPAGLQVHPDGGFYENTLQYMLKARFPQDLMAPVHRLGRGTSGLVVFARNSAAASDLCAQFRAKTAERLSPSCGTVRKLYVARTHRISEALADDIARRGGVLEINTPIGIVPHPRLATVHAATPEGKPSLSYCSILANTADATIWQVEIATGRPNQIRIHLASIGYPLVGDPLFVSGGHVSPNALPGDTGYFLRAFQIEFLHPRTHEQMVFKIDLDRNNAVKGSL